MVEWFCSLCGVDCEGGWLFKAIELSKARVGSDNDGICSTAGFLFCGMTGLTTRWASVKEGDACPWVVYSVLN